MTENRPLFKPLEIGALSLVYCCFFKRGDSSALSIPKGAPIEGIRIWVNVWIIIKSPLLVPYASRDYNVKLLFFGILWGSGLAF